MPRETYVTEEFYKKEYGGSIIPDEELGKALRQASINIDSLTYNRIVGRGFSCLTKFQQETVREVVCRQADFEYENADELGTILSSYSINGVSSRFGDSWSVHKANGVIIRRDNYSLLCQTGLCSRLAR